ncbi:MAG: hypothetical protein NTW12_03655 [Deltaproteobacteria bacterium]|jgi:hypothetical protein|nr:hypothetical protein [Deltaproteobacteria bacterium]
MAKLELTPDEEKELLAILERYRHDLRIEIVNTDDREFRRFLRKREEFLLDLINRLKA